jgi:hypothetical protein
LYRDLEKIRNIVIGPTLHHFFISKNRSLVSPNQKKGSMLTSQRHRNMDKRGFYGYLLAQRQIPISAQDDR